MIHFHRSGSIAPGKTAAALSFAREVSAYIKIGMPIGGNPNRIGWFLQYENLAALEDTQGKLLQDQKYMELIAAAAANFIPGSMHDEIWRVL
jgi:hypothetical protein